jgi:hypothetical protein
MADLDLTQYEIQRLLDDYLAWLKDKTTLRQIDDWVESIHFRVGQ